MIFRIKEIAKSKKITGVELSQKVDITQQNMSNIINGKLRPSLDTLEKIASALGVSLRDLFDREDKDNIITCPNCGEKINITVTGKR
jgi:transcriptional regulator with XRE-family HTH domain